MMNSKSILLLFIAIFTCCKQSLSDNGYIEYKDAKMSYKFISTPITWNAARILCQAQNAMLAMPKTPQQLEALTRAFKTYPPAPGATYPHLFMAGFHDFFDEGSFINLNDRKPIAKFLKWSDGEPNELIIDAQEDCGCFGGDGRLYDYPCHAYGVFFCEKVPNFVQDDYMNYPEAGMNYKFSSDALQWEEARLLCESENASLAMPMNEIQLKTLTDIFKIQPRSNSAVHKELFMAGFHDFFNEGNFVNLNDNNPIPSFLEWQPGEPNELQIYSQQDCGSFGKDGKMWDYPCKSPGVFFCEKPHLQGLSLDF